MIVGHMRYLEQDRQWLPTEVVKVLDWMAAAEWNRLEDGRYELEGAEVYVGVQHYKTTPAAEKQPESHQAYVDIQYVPLGREVIGAEPLTDEHEESSIELEERDLIFYHEGVQESSLLLAPGMYAVFFPWDVHRPGCRATEEAEAVCKAVGKVRVERLVTESE